MLSDCALAWAFGVLAVNALITANPVLAAGAVAVAVTGIVREHRRELQWGST